MSSSKKSIHGTIYNLTPINTDTARAVSGEDKDYECKPKVIEVPKAPPPTSWKGMLRCPVCGCEVLSKNIKKHVVRHTKVNQPLKTD